MNKLILVSAVLFSLSACSKKRVEECDAFVATIDKIAKCDKLDADAKKSIQASAQQMRDALKQIDDAGGIGSAPDDLVKTLRDTCKTQEKTVVDEYTKVAPECVK